MFIERGLTGNEIEALRVFLGEHVSSFEKLEVLLFFVREPGGAWSMSDVAAAVHFTEEVTDHALVHLCDTGGLLEPVPGSGEARAYRLSQSKDTQRLLERLRRAYDEDRVSVIQIMTSNAIERARSVAAQRLANAFRLDRRSKK